MYVANAAILELRIFSQSQEDITSNYGFLLGLVKTFTVDTEKYYPRFYKVNDDKNCKNLVGLFYALCSQIICMYIAGWLIYLTRVLKKHADLVLYIIGSHQKDISNYICQILFICKGPTNFQIKLVDKKSRSPKTLMKRTSADMKL